MSKLFCQCSNCGTSFYTSAAVGVPHGMYYEGYRAVGDALYCPECVKNWKDRNGREFDKDIKDPSHLFATWWNNQVQKQTVDKSKIKAYRQNAVGDYVEAEVNRL